MTNLTIRAAIAGDRGNIWKILAPIFAAGETYCVPRDIGQDAGMAFWSGGSHQTFVAESEGQILGTYYLCPNQQGGGAHVCNCGFATAPFATSKGVARAMLSHGQNTAISQGFRAMQFNFVVASNTRAIAIWEGAGFEIVGRLRHAFSHPTEGYIDALVMFKPLT